VNLSSGFYTVTVTDVNGCTLLDTSTFQLNAVGLPVADFNTIGASENVTFINNSQNGTSYDWGFGDGTTLSTTLDTNITHHFDTSGTYLISLIVHTTAGCTDTFSMSIEVISTNLFNRKKSIISAAILPNPNNGRFVLSVEKLPIDEWKIEIFSITGQLIQSFLQETYQANTRIPIDLQDIRQGMYLLRLSNQKGQMVTKKLIVK
jgi:PKD repeat protein